MKLDKYDAASGVTLESIFTSTWLLVQEKCMRYLRLFEGDLCNMKLMHVVFGHMTYQQLLRTHQICRLQQGRVEVAALHKMANHSLGPELDTLKMSPLNGERDDDLS